MRRFRFAIAVAITSLVLLAIAGAVFVFTTPIGAIAAPGALGNPPWTGGMAFGPYGVGPQGFQLPAELQGLSDLPQTERFAHFVGVQVNLKDKDNNPFTITITPGTVMTASTNSLTVAANDGTSKTFALNSNTIVHGKPVRRGTQGTQQIPANGEEVIVIMSTSNEPALAVIDVGNGDFGPGYFGPPWAHWGRHGW